MKVSTWLSHIRGLKRLTSTETMELMRRLKVSYWPGKKAWKIRDENRICKCCGRPIDKAIIVIFKEGREHLSYFEAYMLYSIFVLRRLPWDYAKFHKSPYGSRFIESIESIWVKGGQTDGTA